MAIDPKTCDKLTQFLFQAMLAVSKSESEFAEEAQRQGVQPGYLMAQTLARGIMERFSVSLIQDTN